MAVEAARACLRGASPRSIVFASTTAPFADRDNAIVLAAALDLPDSTEALNHRRVLRAGTSAFHQRRARSLPDYRLAGGQRCAADARRQPAGNDLRRWRGGAAARAFESHGTRDGTRRPERGQATSSITIAMSGAHFDYALEERWVRDELLLRMPNVVGGTARGSEHRSDAVRHFAVPTGTAAAKRIAEACGLQTARRDERVMRRMRRCRCRSAAADAGRVHSKPRRPEN